MNERDKLARLRDERNHDGFAVRKAEREMAEEEVVLERELKDLEADEERTERQIEDEWRREHWGRDPERPPGWRKDEK
jgi:hypothetical protein